MKYMGSKRSMLSKGLSETIDRHLDGKSRFVDLFAGTATVSHYVAINHNIPVMAVDLQLFSKVLASSILGRITPVHVNEVINDWLSAAESVSTEYHEALARQYEAVRGMSFEQTVLEHREFCSSLTRLPITRSYGGHYFSPAQSIAIDSLRMVLNPDDSLYHLRLASLISAASICVSSPGHTAQPFQPTAGSAKYLQASWERDVIATVMRQASDLASKYSKVIGTATQSDANDLARSLSDTDLVFVDPPYSEVQYSRFYHVLETIAVGDIGSVSGVGRYPDLRERPQSRYSRKSESALAFRDLITSLYHSNASVIITYPLDKTSNGFSGAGLLELCESMFSVRHEVINGQFSTMGGARSARGGRIPSFELVLELTPAKTLS